MSQLWQGVASLWCGGGQALKGVPPVTVIVGETYAMAMVIVMMIVVMVIISYRRMNNLLPLYL